MKNTSILIFIGIISVIIAVVWSRKKTTSSTTTTTSNTTTPTPQVNATKEPTVYDRYKVIYNKGTLLKSNTELYVKPSADINAPYIASVFPNTTLGRATGRYADKDDFRWVEIELSSEVSLISSWRLSLLEAGLTKFWTQQDYIGQATQPPTGIIKPFFS